MGTIRDEMLDSAWYVEKPRRAGERCPVRCRLRDEVKKLVNLEYEKHIERGKSPAEAEHETMEFCRLVLMGSMSSAIYRIRHSQELP